MKLFLYAALPCVWLMSSGFMVHSGYYQFNSDNQQTVNQNATPEAKNVLGSFYQMTAKKPDENHRVFSGQMVSDTIKHIDSDYKNNVIAFKKETGKTPYILGLNYRINKYDFNKKKIKRANDILIKHSNDGGIAAISFTFNNPWDKHSEYSKGFGKDSFEDIFISGTEANKRFIGDLNTICSALQNLEDNNVTVLLSPFPEMNGNSFWWAGLNKNQFSRLWDFTYDYVTQEHGLDNILWVYSVADTSDSGNVNASYYYPGDEHVDIVSMSFYGHSIKFDKGYADVLHLGKPISLSKIGASNSYTSTSPMDNEDVLNALRDNYTEFVYFYYGDGWKNRAIIDNKHAYEFINDPLVVNLR